MGSRQRPSKHTTGEAGGRQAGAGRTAASERALAADQRRHEEEMLDSARDEADVTLPRDEPAGEPPAER